MDIKLACRCLASWAEHTCNKGAHAHGGLCVCVQMRNGFMQAMAGRQTMKRE